MEACFAQALGASDDAETMRKGSPFAGFLTDAERGEIIDTWHRIRAEIIDAEPPWETYGARSSTGQ